MKVIIIAGGAGFIGANLLSELYCKDRMFIILDNLSLGSLSNLSNHSSLDNVIFIKTDLSDISETLTSFERAASYGEVFEVWHLAANSDIPAGVQNYKIDFSNTFLTTVNILEAIKIHDIPLLLFASSSAIYGDHGSTPITENTGPLFPRSYYGAMKLASEALISAANEMYLKNALIFRFPNVIGTPATHGVILDFIMKLVENPNELKVLGDGTQKKSYLHVSDLISAMIHIKNLGLDNKLEVYNIGPNDKGTSVSFIAESTVKFINPNAKIIYGNSNKGWPGDIPKFSYSIDKLVDTGWIPTYNSSEAVLKSIIEIYDQYKVE